MRQRQQRFEKIVNALSGDLYRYAYMLCRNEAMAEDLGRFDVGQIVVYLDGHYFPIEAKDISFEGYFARHDLKVLPHAEALSRPNHLYDMLTDKAYWLERELPDRDW